MKNKKNKQSQSIKKNRSKKEDDIMAVLAKPTNRVKIIGADKSNKFIREFNNSTPPQSFIDSCKKAGELFKRGK